MALLTCENLSLGYAGQPIVRGLSFSVQAGDHLYILGENGAGKSTLMRTLLGLQRPLAGSIRWQEGLTAAQIGYLPQQTQTQRDFPATVWEVALSGCLSRLGKRPFYGRKEKEIARRNLERMGIAALSKRCYRELSGGQQQRVLLARALCAAQQVLLLDEPVAGLDPQATQELYALIEQLNRADGITILMISHDLEAAARYATHVLRLGEPAFFGTVEAYAGGAA